MHEPFSLKEILVLRFKAILESKLPLAICTAAYLCCGCSPKSQPAPKASSIAEVHVSFIPVKDPVIQLCTDDTLSRTDYFNAPVAKFSGTTIDLFGRTATTKDLEEWAAKYYEHKVARALWVQIAPGSVDNAERALVPLIRMFPDLQARQVEFGFSCPKIHD